MTWQTLQNFGALSLRPGTASLGRNHYLGFAVGLAHCPGVSMHSVITSAQGGRTP